MDKKVKDYQPPFQDEREGLSYDQITGNPQGWDREDIANNVAENMGGESSYKDADEIQRQLLRGDETKGDPNDRDVAGASDSNETAHGREEAKNDIEGKANANG